jgi:hypothetical protein
MQKSKNPMLTRISEKTRESLKALAADPEYGNLTLMYEKLFETFITEEPYRLRSFEWHQPAKRGTPHWAAYNIVVSAALAARVKDVSKNLEVSLTTLIYTALLWWIERLRLKIREQK